MAQRQPQADTTQAEMGAYHDAGWETVDMMPVYTIELECPEGFEVALRELKTEQHKETGDERHRLEQSFETQFVFRDSWPANDLLEEHGVTHAPYSMYAE